MDRPGAARLARAGALDAVESLECGGERQQEQHDNRQAPMPVGVTTDDTRPSYVATSVKLNNEVTHPPHLIVR
jgi:hypothetical protein